MAKLTRRDRRLDFEAEVLLVNAFFKTRKSGVKSIDDANMKNYPVVKLPLPYKWEVKTKP